MNVTIVGAGNMARGIASRLVEGGHTVALIDRNWQKASALAADLGDGTAGAAEVVSLDRGLANPVIVLALPFAAARDSPAPTRRSSPGRSSSTSPTRSTPPMTGWSPHPARVLPKRSPTSCRRAGW